MNKTAVVVPNWNGKDSLADCLDSLLAQSEASTVIVVENGSIDGSLEFLQTSYPQVELVINQRNLGFAGGVNSGIHRAMELGFEYVALFNNDAVADRDWLKHLCDELGEHPTVGIATCKFMSIDGSHLDSTGDWYTIWGLPYPRGRGETVSTIYDSQTAILGASGGASLYRVQMLQEIGLFDEDFFAYYEDVDISLRAQLAGWKVQYVPGAIAYHQIGATSGKIRGFTTYQTIKNLPWVLWKNIPCPLIWRMAPRFLLAYLLFTGRAVARGQAWWGLKGVTKMLLLLPKKTIERRRIQRERRVTVAYIDSLLVHDLPPNASSLRKLRAAWWKMRRKSA